MAKRQAVQIQGRTSAAHLSPAVRVGDLVWTSGTTGRDPATGEMPDGIEAQTRNTLDNLKAALEAAGTSWDNVIKVNVYLADINLRPQFNDIYLQYAPSDRPSRTAIGSVGFEGNTLVEVECVAVVD
jgi:2-iminobutanoate/2-iminopropanoate deaminase